MSIWCIVKRESQVPAPWWQWPDIWNGDASGSKGTGDGGHVTGYPALGWRAVGGFRVCQGIVVCVAFETKDAKKEVF